ncbi:hypothetical protein BELL_0178g00100 [Botrytis elliptica]|uniref:Uncharacterized protein n=1 Tax=Botrytis elliptica TaxID=278938 RepID=A0A4Z1JR08_9HELO|nr:hypothetical protein BELL_0178g00100 [Botrytis elliptica]
MEPVGALLIALCVLGIVGLGIGIVGEKEEVEGGNVLGILYKIMKGDACTHSALSKRERINQRKNGRKGKKGREEMKERKEKKGRKRQERKAGKKGRKERQERKAGKKGRKERQERKAKKGKAKQSKAKPGKEPKPTSKFSKARQTT